MAEDNEEQARKEKGERELSEHDRMMARNAAHVSRDVLHDASAGQEPGAYTTQEARDRAAHTPSILERLDQPRNRHEEALMLDALHKECFPTEKAREEYDQRSSPEQPPKNAEARQQWQDFRQMNAPEKFDSTKESTAYMTPEQQASIDKALGRADINDKIGGASDVGGKPQPNDITPLDKSRDIGQDLRKQGVTMDKE